jgi:hypothetical protein
MGILGKVAPATTSYTLAYVVPQGKQAVCSVNVTNTSLLNNKIYVAISSADDLGIANINVASAGSGYKSIPKIAIVDNGSSPAAIVNDMIVTNMTPKNGGLGYVIGDLLTLVGGTGNAATVTVLTVNASGSVTSVGITDPGLYTELSLVDFTTTGGSGDGCTFDVTKAGYGIASVTVATAGNNYTTAPVVTATGGTVGATFTLQMTRASIETGDVIEYAVNIPPSNVLERTGLTLAAGDAIFVQASVANGLNVFVFGVEALA